jgi:hypothetical protein
MMGGCHSDICPESLTDIMDAPVIGGNNKFLEVFGLFGSFIDPLDHGFSQDQSERLPWKTL